VSDDDGTAISYEVLPRGTEVVGSDGGSVGTIHEVLDNAREHIFDGIEVERSDGVRVFVDAPEVARTAERAVTLAITSAEVAEYPPAKGGGGLMGRLFGR
jgi:hypothetical protein